MSTPACTIVRRPGWTMTVRFATVPGNIKGNWSMLESREGGCHCGQVRFRAQVDLDRLSWCNCSICTKKGIIHLSTVPADFQLLRGKDALTVYTFETGVAQHTFCKHCGM